MSLCALTRPAARCHPAVRALTLLLALLVPLAGVPQIEVHAHDAAAAPQAGHTAHDTGHHGNHPTPPAAGVHCHDHSCAGHSPALLGARLAAVPPPGTPPLAADPSPPRDAPVAPRYRPPTA